MKYSWMLLSLILGSCIQHNPESIVHMEHQIFKADRVASTLASQIGFNNALLSFADSSFVKLGNGQLPIIGKTAYTSSFNKSNDIKTITWQPINVEVAKSGDLGFSWGNWQFKTQDTTYYGNYITIWKKQSDGTWKMRLDGGNDTPKPKS
ncbi:MAG: nuclear transport factor 2 family protein [Allomuricauda sp.]